MDMKILPLEERIVMDAAGFGDLAEVVVAQDVSGDALDAEAVDVASGQLAAEATLGAVEAVTATSADGLVEQEFVALNSLEIGIDDLGGEFSFDSESGLFDIS